VKDNRFFKKAIIINSIIVILTLLLQFTFAAAEDFPRALHLSWQNDPATTMTVMWRSEPGAEGIVEYGKDSEYTHSIESETHGYKFGRTEIFWHIAEITDLEPNTTYCYQVKTSEPWESEEYTFKTAVPKWEDTPFKFAVMCDSQGGYDNQTKIFEMVREENVDFILFLGDFTDTGNQEEWDIWFGTGEGVLANVPLMGVHGNHEGDRKTYWDQFAFPGNERWFSIDYGNVHFVFLFTTSEASAAEQRPWLLKDLRENNNTWTIAMGHIPIYSAGLNHGESQYLIDHWVDIFERYSVDLYFSGHNHVYERTWPIKNGSIDREGITYLTHGPAGDKFYSVGNSWWTAVSVEKIPMYTKYSVEGSRIKAKAKSIDGEVVDEFELEHPYF
jgi:predicted phosphodiesterase